MQVATKSGSRYSNEIRELYYHLLAQQLPPAKVEQRIRTVLKQFAPGIDLANLKLPKASLAADMRSLEMPTVSASHQAHLLSEVDEHHLNSDGTTLNQKKVQGMLMNGVVLGVKDVVDGSAKAAIKELGRVLDHIRDVGLQLNLPGADRIGWALIETSMSDQASTQKAFNNLLQQNIDSERKEGSRACTNANSEQKKVLQLFCGMHLGVNLRTAQVKSVSQHFVGKTVGVDSVVHAICKLLGHLGSNPEYGKGVQAFPEYIKSIIDQAEAIGDDSDQISCRGKTEQTSRKQVFRDCTKCGSNILPTSTNN